MIDVAEAAYIAYSQSTDNKNFRGEEMPKFEALPQAIKDAWVAAVSSVSLEGRINDYMRNEDNAVLYTGDGKFCLNIQRII